MHFNRCNWKIFLFLFSIDFFNRCYNFSTLSLILLIKLKMSFIKPTYIFFFSFCLCLSSPFPLSFSKLLIALLLSRFFNVIQFQLISFFLNLFLFFLWLNFFETSLQTPFLLWYFSKETFYFDNFFNKSECFSRRLDRKIKI